MFSWSVTLLSNNTQIRSDIKIISCLNQQDNEEDIIRLCKCNLWMARTQSTFQVKPLKLDKHSISFLLSFWKVREQEEEERKGNVTRNLADLSEKFASLLVETNHCTIFILSTLVKLIISRLSTLLLKSVCLSQNWTF